MRGDDARRPRIRKPLSLFRRQQSGGEGMEMLVENVLAACGGTHTLRPRAFRSSGHSTPPHPEREAQAQAQAQARSQKMQRTLHR